MSDLERLDEALATWDSWRSLVEKRYPDAFSLGSLRVHRTLADAARAYRDLLANGERVEWCETHRLPMSDPSEAHEEVCAIFYMPGQDEEHENCRIVSKLLVDPPPRRRDERR